MTTQEKNKILEVWDFDKLRDMMGMNKNARPYRSEYDIAQNKFNRVVVWQNRSVNDVNLDSIAGFSKTINFNDPLIKVAKALNIYIGEI